MKVLVVGGTGFLGSTTARELRERHHEVVVTSRNGHHEAEWASGLRILQWDVGNDWMLDETSFDVILHFAGPNDDISSRGTPDDALSRTQRVLNLWRRSGGSVLYVSTFQVFGRWAGQVRCTDRAIPISVYGQSHLRNEYLLKEAFSELPRGLLIVRPTNIVGQSANPLATKWHRVPAEFCLQAASGSPIRIRSDSQTQRDYLSVSDFANRIASLVDLHQQWDCRAVTIGSGKSYSLLKVANLVRQLATETLGLQVPIIESSSSSSSPDELLQVHTERWSGIDLVGESKLKLQDEVKNLLLLARNIAGKNSDKTAKNIAQKEHSELA